MQKTDKEKLYVLEENVWPPIETDRHFSLSVYVAAKQGEHCVNI